MKQKNVLMPLGLFFIILIFSVGLLAPWISPQDPNEMHLEQQYQSPSRQHPFGLDENGSDVFSKVAYGARVSLLVACSVVLISLTVGLVLGSLAGFYGGKMETLIMRAIDIVSAFPGFLLALGLIAV